MAMGALALGLWMAAGQALAQQPANSQKGRFPGQPAEQMEAPEPGPLITVQFPGGTVTQYVRVLQSVVPGANIVVSRRASEVTLAGIELRDVGLETAVWAIRSAGPEAGSWDIDTLPSMRRGTVAFGVDVRERPEMLERRSGSIDRLEVFSLAPVADVQGKSSFPGALGAEVVLGAVKQAVEIAAERAPGQAGAELKYHKESGLLIVRGGPEALDAVRQVLGKLERDTELRHEAIDRMRAEEKMRLDVRMTVRKAQMEAEKAAMLRDLALRNVQRVLTLAKDGQVSDQERTAAETQAKEAEQRLRVAELEVQQAEATAKMYQAASEGGVAVIDVRGVPPEVVKRIVDEASARVAKGSKVYLRLEDGQIRIQGDDEARGAMEQFVQMELEKAHGGKPGDQAH